MIADQFGHLTTYCQGDGIEFGENHEHISKGLQVRNARHDFPGVRSAVSRHHNIKYEASSVDFVCCLHYLEHFDDWERIVRYWWSLLKVGGKLVIGLPEAGRYPLVGDPTCNPDHRQDFSLKTFLPALDSFGFHFKAVVKGYVNDNFYLVVEKLPEAMQTKDTVRAEETPTIVVAPPVRCRYSVVIPFYNHITMTQKCVDRLFAVAKPDEVVLVNDGSSQKYPADSRVRMVKLNRNSGFPFAVNRGVNDAKHEFVVLLNNDVTLNPGGIEKLLDVLRDPSVAMVGQDGGTLDRDYVFQGKVHQDPAYVEMFCCAFRKSVWRTVGPLDLDFGRGYCEDSDWGLRAKKRGYRLVATPGLCQHAGSSTFGKGPEIVAHIERNRQKLIAKHHRGRALWVMASLGCNGGSKVVQKLAGAMLDDGWQVDVCSLSPWTNAAKEWERFGQRTPQDMDPYYDVVISTYHSTMPFASSLRCKHRFALIQSDEPEWGPDPVAKSNFCLPGFKHIVIADHMQAFAKKYGMTIVGQLDNGVDNITFTPKWTFDREWPHGLMLIRKCTKVWFDGQEYAEQAVAELARRYRDLSVTVLDGDRPNWPCRVNHVRTYDEEAICDLYNQVSCMVVPSLIEGSSLVPLEAMASGCPVVSTSVGMHYATDGVNYLNVPYQNSGAIVEAVSRVFDDEKLRWNLYREGLTLAHSRTWEREQEQFLSILKQETK